MLELNGVLFVDRFCQKQLKRRTKGMSTSINENQTEFATKEGLMEFRKHFGFRFNLLLMVDVTNSISLCEFTSILTTFGSKPKFNRDTYCLSWQKRWIKAVNVFEPYNLRLTSCDKISFSSILGNFRQWNYFPIDRAFSVAMKINRITSGK